MKYDVVIVGAGPSGSTAAKIIAENGLKVLLVDKEKFPRNKPCGGGLPLRTLTRFPYLKDIGVIETNSFGGIVYAPSLENKVSITKNVPVIAMIQRAIFDNALVELAVEKGAVFKDNLCVRDLKISSDGVQLFFKNDTIIKTDLVIGADGCNSIIAAKSKLGLLDKPRAICVLEEFQLPRNTIDSIYHNKRICHIHSRFRGIRGYGWIFPKENNINVGIISYDHLASPHIKLNINGIFNDYISLLKKSGLLPTHVKSMHMGGGLVPYQPVKKPYADRLLLCGDAAGFINPITGEGIYYALASGEIAGNTASKAIELQKFDERTLSEYNEKCFDDFGKEIKFLFRSKDQWGKNGEKIITLMNCDDTFADLVFSIMVGKENLYYMRWKLILRYLLASIKSSIRS